MITGKFEDVAMRRDKFDLVFSASAFHWVPEEIGYKKVYDILKPGGAFARFANHPYRDKSNSELSEAINELYLEYYYGFYKEMTPGNPVEYTEQDAIERAQIASGYGFEDIQYALYSRIRTFTAEEYIALINTYSDHIAMVEEVRTEFYAKMKETIEIHGGLIHIYDTMDLQLARKPLL